MSNSKRFVNRVNELRVFLDEIGQIRSSNRVIVLEAPSGVGKSSFTHKLLEEQRAGPGIKVPLMSGASPDGYLIAETARVVSESAGVGGYRSLQQYIVDLPQGSEMRRRYHATLTDKLTALDPTEVSGIATTMVRRKLGAGEFNVNNLFKSFYGEEISLLADYLKHVFTHRKLLINIENVQDADRVSLILLRELLEVQTGQYVILEYTTGGTCSNELDEFLALLGETRSDVTHYALRKLPFEDVRRLITDRDATRLLEKAYLDYDGNLRAVTDLDVMIKRGLLPAEEPGSFTIRESTPLRIERLNKGAIFTLSCIAAHRSGVKADLLYRLYRDHEIFRATFISFDTALVDLEAEEMIHVENGLATVAHDSITRAILEGVQFQRYLLVAYELWSRAYTEINDQREYVLVTRSETLSYLFHFYSHTDAVRLLSVLDEVREVALESLRPASALALLQQIQDIIESHKISSQAAMERAAYQLLDIQYLLGLYEQGEKLVRTISRRTPQRDIYHVALLIVQDRDAEAVVLLEGLIKERYSTEPWYEFFLQLFLMVGYRCVDRMNDCERVFKKMRNNKNYRELPEYGLLLRNAEIVMENDDAIPYLAESVSCFQARGLAVPEAQSRISLGVNYTISGQLDLAVSEFDAAEFILRGRAMKRHVILNDRATVLLLRDPPQPDQAVELLTNALRTITGAFERIVVLNNLLIAQVQRRNIDALEELGKELLRLVANHTFTDLHRITYINLAYGWSAFGSEQMTTYYRRRAQELGDGGDPYFAHVLFGTPIVDSESNFMARFPFRPAFLANWDTEMSEFIPAPH